MTSGRQTPGSVEEQESQAALLLLVPCENAHRLGGDARSHGDPTLWVRRQGSSGLAVGGRLDDASDLVLEERVRVELQMSSTMPMFEADDLVHPCPEEDAHAEDERAGSRR
jgi:hypothetical protein